MNENADELVALARRAGIRERETVARPEKVREAVARLEGQLPPGYRLQLMDRFGVTREDARPAPAVCDLLIEGFPSDTPLRLHIVRAGHDREPHNGDRER